MNLCAGPARGVGQSRCQPRTDRVGKGDVNDDSISEEGAGPFEGAIDKLVGDDHLAGMDVFPEAPSGAHRNQVLRAEALHPENVGAEIYLAGQNAMALAVAREKDDLGVTDMSADKRIRWFAKGGIDF